MIRFWRLVRQKLCEEFFLRSRSLDLCFRRGKSVKSMRIVVLKVIQRDVEGVGRLIEVVKGKES